MNILEKRKLLKNKIFSLQDEVSRILSIDNDVDLADVMFKLTLLM